MDEWKNFKKELLKNKEVAEEYNRLKNTRRHQKVNKTNKTGSHNFDLGIMGKLDREHIYSYLDEKFNLKNKAKSCNLKPNE